MRTAATTTGGPAPLLLCPQCCFPFVAVRSLQDGLVEGGPRPAHRRRCMITTAIAVAIGVSVGIDVGTSEGVTATMTTVIAM